VDDVVQFSYVSFDASNQMYDAGCLYFYYEGMSWSESAEEVHHISRDFLKQYADDFKANCIRMWTVLSGANVVGHNSKTFDCPFVTSWLARMGLMGLKFGSINDTMRAFRPAIHHDKIKLTKLLEMYGLTPEVIRNAANMWFGDVTNIGPHDATYDTTATALLTLIALSKGYMSFDAARIERSVEADVSLLYDTPITNVDFTLIEPDGSERVHTYCGHSDGNTIEFPFKLKYVAHNRYEANVYTLKINGNNDEFSMTVLGTTTVFGKNFDLIEYTKKLTKGGS